MSDFNYTNPALAAWSSAKVSLWSLPDSVSFSCRRNRQRAYSKTSSRSAIDSLYIISAVSFIIKSSSAAVREGNNPARRKTFSGGSLNALATAAQKSNDGFRWPAKIDETVVCDRSARLPNSLCDQLRSSNSPIIHLINFSFILTILYLTLNF